MRRAAPVLSAWRWLGGAVRLLEAGRGLEARVERVPRRAGWLGEDAGSYCRELSGDGRRVVDLERDADVTCNAAADLDRVDELRLRRVRKLQGRPHAVRDGLLITGQQQFSGTAAARLIIVALGV